ncbi:hypothetical protein Hanom_Chr07g00645161 [Helianthus anomalus]
MGSFAHLPLQEKMATAVATFFFFFFFLNGQQILQMGYWRNSPHRDTFASEPGKTLT